MQRMLEKILNCYGSEVQIWSGDEVYDVRAFLQPVTGRGENMVRIGSSPLGREEKGQYVYIGPVKPGVKEGDSLLCGDESYILRRCETVAGIGGPAYCWGMCIRKGAEDTWGLNG